MPPSSSRFLTDFSETPRNTLRRRLASQCQRFAISSRIASLVRPSFFSKRPKSSSSFPSENATSSSVSCPYFCFSFPFTSFQPPLNCNLVIVLKNAPGDEVGRMSGFQTAWLLRLASFERTFATQARNDSNGIKLMIRSGATFAISVAARARSMKSSCQG